MASAPNHGFEWDAASRAAPLTRPVEAVGQVDLAQEGMRSIIDASSADFRTNHVLGGYSLVRPCDTRCHDQTTSRHPGSWALLIRLAKSENKSEPMARRLLDKLGGRLAILRKHDFASRISFGEVESVGTSEREMENSSLRNDAVFPPNLSVSPKEAKSHNPFKSV
jgi:hypothetical protein